MYFGIYLSQHLDVVPTYAYEALSCPTAKRREKQVTTCVDRGRTTRLCAVAHLVQHQVSTRHDTSAQARWTRTIQRSKTISSHLHLCQQVAG